MPFDAKEPNKKAQSISEYVQNECTGSLQHHAGHSPIILVVLTHGMVSGLF